MIRIALVALAVLALADTAGAVSPNAELERARTAFAAGRYVDALEIIRRATDMAPTVLPVVLARARIAEFMGEFDEAAAF